ncbi:MAG: F0F1 ATP synthase subunit B [Lachnospirales bacterium]
MDSILHLDAAFFQNLLVQWGATVVLFAFLGYFLYKPVLKFMNDRTEGIEKNIEEAEQNMADAKALKAEYSEKMSNIMAERNEILEKANKDARANEANIIAKAREEAQVIKDRALLDIEREQAKAEDDMKTQIIEISTLMAQKYIEESISAETQNRLLDEVIKDMEGAKWPS